jgi:hypothetical protein
MKRKNFYAGAICCILCGATVGGYAEEKVFLVTVANEREKARIDEPVVLDARELACGFNIASAIVASTADGLEVASQLDDLDGDMIADELVFVVDLPPKSAKTFSIVASSAGRQPEYPSRVYAEMLVSDRNGRHVPITSLTIPGTSNIYNQLHHHGPAFESELVAYRIYFDRKQTVDIYGKFHKGYELQESQFYPTDGQLARGFGDDVLLVGGSCGLGTLKGWDGAKATHIEPHAFLTETVRAGGPVRTVVDVISDGWQYQGAVLQMRVRYLLYAGHRDCEVQVAFDRPLSKEIFATGVLRIRESASHSDHRGLIACWGTDWPVNDTVKYAKETVGLAVALPPELIRSEISDGVNFLYQISAEGRQGFTYHITFTSLKETFGYKTPASWFAHAAEWKDCLQHPATVTVSAR